MSDFVDLDSDLGGKIRLQKVSDHKRDRARLTAARYAESADDLRLLLAVLGLDDNTGAPPCRQCGDPISRLAACGYNQSAGDGLCARCFQAVRKAAAALAEQEAER